MNEARLWQFFRLHNLSELIVELMSSININKRIGLLSLRNITKNINANTFSPCPLLIDLTLCRYRKFCHVVCGPSFIYCVCISYRMYETTPAVRIVGEPKHIIYLFQMISPISTTANQQKIIDNLKISPNYIFGRGGGHYWNFLKLNQVLLTSL